MSTRVLFRLVVAAILCLAAAAAGATEDPANAPVATEGSTAAPAATPAPPAPANKTGLVGTGSAVTPINPLTVFLGLAFILLLIFASAWLMKRLGGAHFGASGGMKVVAGLSVGPREKVLLIEVGGQQVLVGVAPGRVSHLQSYAEPVLDAHAPAAGDFSQRLRSMIGPGPRRHSGDPGAGS